MAVESSDTNKYEAMYDEWIDSEFGDIALEAVAPLEDKLKIAFLSGVLVQRVKVDGELSQLKKKLAVLRNTVNDLERLIEGKGKANRTTH